MKRKAQNALNYAFESTSTLGDRLKEIQNTAEQTLNSVDRTVVEHLEKSWSLHENILRMQTQFISGKLENQDEPLSLVAQLTTLVHDIETRVAQLIERQTTKEIEERIEHTRRQMAKQVKQGLKKLELIEIKLRNSCEENKNLFKHVALVAEIDAANEAINNAYATLKNKVWVKIFLFCNLQLICP